MCWVIIEVGYGDYFGYNIGYVIGIEVYEDLCFLLWDIMML